MDRPPLLAALAQRDKVMRAFIDSDGRIKQLPARAGKRMVLLDHVAQAFDVGRRYRESEVNEILLQFFDDYASLRRFLVDADLLTRSEGIYWRTGGTVDT